MRAWKGIGPQSQDRWNVVTGDVFSHDSVSRPACPECAHAPLRYFFWRHGTGRLSNRGGFWVWGPSCLTYMHASCEVPDWWIDVPNIDPKLLDHQPEWLE